MPNKAYHFVEFADTKNAIEYYQVIFRSAFNRNAPTEYVANVYGGESGSHSYFVFNELNEPLGFLGFAVAKFDHFGEHVTGVQGASWMMHSSARGSGAFMKLYKHAHKSEREKGVDFFFGLASKGEGGLYHLLLRLKWKTMGRMQHYRKWIYTLPISYAVNRLTFLRPIYNWYTKIIINKYRIYPSEFGNSAIDSGAVGSVRNTAFLSARASEQAYFLEIEGIQLWIKLTGTLWIGDIVSLDEDSMNRVLKKLTSIARTLGIMKIEFQVSGGAPLDVVLKNIVGNFDESFEGDYIVYDKCNPNLNYKDIKLSFCDLDGFGI